MPGIMICPECGRQLAISEEMRGRPLRCPHCLCTMPPANEEDPAELPPMPDADVEQLRIDAAVRAVQMPGLCLLLVGLFNVINGVLMFVGGLGMLNQPEEHLPAMREMFERFGLQAEAEDPARLRAQVEINGWLYAVFGPIGSFLGLMIAYAALRMRSLRSLGLARLSAVIAMLPFLSPCCLMGFPLGVWCLVVLGRREVALAFER